MVYLRSNMNEMTSIIIITTEDDTTAIILGAVAGLQFDGGESGNK